VPQGVAQRAGNVFRRVLEDEVMLPGHHVRPLLLLPRRPDQDRRLAGALKIAHLGPRELFEEDRVGGTLPLRRLHRGAGEGEEREREGESLHLPDLREGTGSGNMRRRSPGG
jgi:hypothetical protein